ncbi:hypothetical protein TrST_g2292 [Triparma strigata]|uniref:Uncharacterized protein n=1 Tax=Triparma strigata TaxID=1606541 RepID=A0A9W7E7T7_9STRA|nr:hypothetical protein TrST_g2292 [Triparma strigata]
MSGRHLTGDVSLDDEIIFMNDEAAVNIPLRKSSSLGRGGRGAGGGVANGDDVDARLGGSRFSRPSTSSSFTRPHNSFASSRKPCYHSPEDDDDVSENDGDDDGMGGFGDLDSLRDDDSVDLRRREAAEEQRVRQQQVQADEARRREAEKRRQSVADIERRREEEEQRRRREKEEREEGQGRRASKSRSRRHSQDDEFGLQQQQSTTSGPNKQGKKGLLSSLRPSQWGTVSSPSGSSSRSGGGGLSQIKEDNTFGGRGDKRKEKMMGKKELSNSRKLLKAALGGEPKKKKKKTQGLSQSLTQQQQAHPVALTQTPAVDEDDRFSFGKSFSMSQAPPQSKSPDEPVEPTDNIALDNPATPQKKGIDQMYQRNVISTTPTKKNTQNPGPIESSVADYTYDCNLLNRRSVLYGYDPLDSNDPRHNLTSISVECVVEKRDWEFLNICKCKVISSTDGRAEEGAELWVALKKDFEKLEAVGDRIKFWGAEIHDGVVFGTDRYEEIGNDDRGGTKTGEVEI